MLYLLNFTFSIVLCMRTRRGVPWKNIPLWAGLKLWIAGLLAKDCTGDIGGELFDSS